MKLRARNLRRRGNGDYNPINLDYIFEQDDPLDDWLAGREVPVLSNTDFLDEAMADVDEFESNQEGEGQRSPHPLRRSATTREKGKNVATSSSQGSQRQGSRHQQRGQSREPEMTRSTSERISSKGKSTSHSAGGSSGALSKAKQWIRDPTLQYRRKPKDKRSTHTQSQSQRLATHEEEGQCKTSSSSKNGSPEGDQGLNEQAYEGSDGGDCGGGEDNIIVYDPLHGGQSEPSGGYGRNEGNEPSKDYGHGHQVLGSQISIVRTAMDGQDSSIMETHTMILHMSMGSSMVGTVVLRMGMGNNNMES